MEYIKNSISIIASFSKKSIIKFNYFIFFCKESINVPLILMNFID